MDDEPCLPSSYHERTRWVASWDDAPIVESLSHSQKKPMLSRVFNGTGEFLINILPEGMQIDTDYFADNIIDEMARLCCSQGRRPREGRIMLHFDIAPILCTGTMRDRMAAAELERMAHPPYSPDLAPYDFFVFGYIKGKLLGTQYPKPEDLVSQVRNSIEGIRPALLKNIIESWKGRLLDCWNSNGEYVE
jgi:hypothetical protein